MFGMKYPKELKLTLEFIQMWEIDAVFMWCFVFKNQQNAYSCRLIYLVSNNEMIAVMFFVVYSVWANIIIQIIPRFYTGLRFNARVSSCNLNNNVLLMELGTANAIS